MAPSTTPRSRQKPRNYASLAEAAQAHAVSVKTLRRRIADGSLTGYRFGPKIIRVDLDEVAALMKPTRGGGA